jgi:hypothetical protein
MAPPQIEKEYWVGKGWQKTFLFTPKKSIKGEKVWGFAYKRDVRIKLYIRHEGTRFSVEEGDGMVWRAVKHHSQPFTQYATKKEYFVERLKGNDIQDSVLARRISPKGHKAHRKV